MIRRRLLVSFFVIATLGSWRDAPAADAPKPRGLWFWSKPASPDGSVNILGHADREAEALATFRRWNIRRLYGSYAALPLESPAVLAAWNRQLHAAGIRSETLFSNTSAISVEGRARFLREIDERVLRFNTAQSDAAARFDGIALDLEPHTLERWKTGTPTNRRALLDDLLATCAALRRQLDEHDAHSLAISAAIPPWFDKLPPEGKIGWASATDRDEWFAQLARSVATVSLMTYETNRPATIAASTEWERTHFAGTTIVALRARLGLEWKSLADLTRVLPAVEAPLTLGIDLENYELLRAAERAAAK